MDNSLELVARYAGRSVRARVVAGESSRESADARLTWGDAVRAFARACGLDERTTRVHGCDGLANRCATVESDAALPESGAGLRLMVTGSRREATAALARDSTVDARVIGFEEEERRERMRRGGAAANASSVRTRFGTIEALPTRAGATPSSEAALALLRRLAADPGILGVMESHGWTVGKLCEMPPEGKVGVSEYCVLGYNTNRGESIHLRLRTDDYKGFRDYVTIRRTLLHELAHNVHSNHGPEFRELNSLLNVECQRLDWKRAADAAVSRRASEAYQPKDDDGYVDPLDVMAVTKASSGSALGGAGSARTADDLRRARLERFSAAPSRDADAELNAAADEALRNAGIES